MFFCFVFLILKLILFVKPLEHVVALMETCCMFQHCSFSSVVGHLADITLKLLRKMTRQVVFTYASFFFSFHASFCLNSFSVLRSTITIRRDNRRDELNRIKLVCFILFFINFKLKPNYYIEM